MMAFHRPSFFPSFERAPHHTTTKHLFFITSGSDDRGGKRKIALGTRFKHPSLPPSPPPPPLQSLLYPWSRTLPFTRTMKAPFSGRSGSARGSGCQFLRGCPLQYILQKKRSLAPRNPKPQSRYSTPGPSSSPTCATLLPEGASWQEHATNFLDKASKN
jgi:hypothetical protein